MSDGTFQHDRGAFRELRFTRCVLGFTLTACDDIERRFLNHPQWAFDRVEDLAAWLVEQYADQDDPHACCDTQEPWPVIDANGL